jgi:hypothetical protein
MSAPAAGDAREKALAGFRKKLLEHKEADAKVRQCTRLKPPTFTRP